MRSVFFKSTPPATFFAFLTRRMSRKTRDSAPTPCLPVVTPTRAAAVRMWAPRDTSAGTPEASSPRHVARGVADADTDVPGGRVDALPFSEASRGRRREDENETEDWCVGGFDVFERRTSPLRRKRAPLVPSEFDHDALVRRALEQARGGEKGVGPAHLATRAPLRALVPGNASLHRRAEEASVRERARRGLSFDTRGDTRGGTATPATPSVAFAFSEPRPFVKRRPISSNAAEDAPKPSPPRTPASRENRKPTASANDRSSRDSNGCDSLLSLSPACSEASEASSFWSAEKKQQKRENGVSVSSLSVTEAANARGSESVASQVLDRNRDEDRDEDGNEENARLRARVHARRRHRKRLAVIVVAQWRWFARDALESLPARMHAAWRRKRNAMREWRRVAGEEASFAALRAVAAERERRLAKTLRAFTHRREREQREVSRDVVPVDTIRSDGNDATDASAMDASASRDHDDSAFVASATAAAVIAFRRWRRFAKTRVAKRARRRERASLADARAAATRTKKARASLRLWRDVARDKKTRRVAATRVVETAKVFFRRNRLSRAFCEWRRVTRDARTKRALFVARLDRDRAFRFALRALDAWQDASRVQRVTRVTVERAWNAWDALARRARWRLGVAASHEAAAACEKTRRVARAWRNVAKAKSQKRVKAESALTFRKTHDTKRLLLCFRAAFIEPSLEARAARCADAFFDRTRARLAFRAWRAENAASQRMTAVTTRFASRRASSILAVTFGAWRGPFLRRARLRRADKSKLARALATRHALVTCRAFIGWSYRARVVGRSKRRCAADATRHRRAFLVTAAFTEWVARVQDARSLDALSDAKLETARAALGATKTARVFDAWLERTKTKLARRAVVTFAERRCVRSKTAKTVAAWRNRVLVKRASRDAYARATNHYETRRLAFDSMEAWVLVLCASRLRRAKTQKANAFRSRVVLKRRVFPAWIAFVAVQKKRRDEIRDALAAFKADATRAGCAAWLREGLRRRELRREQSLTFVADEAARRSAEIWRVVGRFARRWLRVTRRRARRRKEKQSRLFDATVFPISAATEPNRAATETYGDPTEVCTVESRRTTVSAGESAMDVTQEPPVFPSSKETRSASTRNAFTDVFKEGKDSYGNHQSDEVYRVSAAVVAPRRRRPPRRLDAGGGGVPPRAAAPPSTVSIPSTASIGRPPKRSGSLSFGAAAMDARLDARTDAGQFQSGDHQMILNRENVNALLLSPARLLDAHERCICEFEALKAESARIRDALAETDASLASNAITECVASVRKASLTTAAQATRRRRAELLPAVRAAAAALGEYRSDMATSVASGW